MLDFAVGELLFVFIAVINRLYRAPFDIFNIAAIQNPLQARFGQAAHNIKLLRFIGVGAGCVIYCQAFAIGQGYFTHRDFVLADVNFFGRRQSAARNMSG